MTVSDFEKFSNVREKRIPVGAPDLVMKKDPDAVEPQVLGPAQFLVNLCRIECARLPHLDLVARICRDIIAPNRPLHGGIPFIGLFFGPTLCDGLHFIAGADNRRQRKYCQ